MSISLEDHSGLGKPMYERMIHNKKNGDRIVLCIWSTVPDDAGGWKTPFRIYVNNIEVFGFGAFHRDGLHSLLLAIEHARKYFEFHNSEQDLEFDLSIQSHGLPYFNLSDMRDDASVEELRKKMREDAGSKIT